MSRFLFDGGVFITRKQNDDLVNESIRFREVLVIGPDGNQLGKMSSREAYKVAQEEGLDLVCVAPNSPCPVCKILDYGKYRFEKQKAAKEAKKKQSFTEVKPLRLSPVIDTHDFNTKVNQARKWLEQGMKVKADMRFRSRMMTRQEVGMVIMNDFIDSLKDVGSIDKQPKLEGNIMSCVISPIKK